MVLEYATKLIHNVGPGEYNSSFCVLRHKVPSLFSLEKLWNVCCGNDGIKRRERELWFWISLTWTLWFPRVEMERRIACNFAGESLCRKGVAVITAASHLSEKGKLPPVQSDVKYGRQGWASARWLYMGRPAPPRSEGQEHAVAAGTHLQGTIYRVTEHHGTHKPRSDHREPFLVHFPGGEVRAYCEIRGSASGGLEMGRRAGCNSLCRKLGHPCGGRKLQHSKPLSFQNRLFSLYRLLFSKKINF